MENWELLKQKLNEQLTDIDKHSGASGNWSVCRRIYNEVLNMMTAIEQKRSEELLPFNGVWHTKEEMQHIFDSEFVTKKRIEFLKERVKYLENRLEN